MRFDMDGTITSTILGAACALFAGLNIFQFIFFRSTKKQYEAKAEMAATDTSDAKHDYLVKRIESMEKLYLQQGQELDKMRSEYLRLNQDIMEKSQRIKKLESENETMGRKIKRMEEELQAYKTINRK